jgi:hypothetical protein
MAVKTGMDTSATSPPRLKLDEVALLRYMRVVRSASFCCSVLYFYG